MCSQRRPRIYDPVSAQQNLPRQFPAVEWIVGRVFSATVLIQQYQQLKSTLIKLFEIKLISTNETILPEDPPTILNTYFSNAPRMRCTSIGTDGDGARVTFCV